MKTGVSVAWLILLSVVLMCVFAGGAHASLVWSYDAKGVDSTYVFDGKDDIKFDGFTTLLKNGNFEVAGLISANVSQGLQLDTGVRIGYKSPFRLGEWDCSVFIGLNPYFNITGDTNGEKLSLGQSRWPFAVGLAARF